MSRAIVERAQTQKHHRPLSDAKPTCGLFPSALDLSLTELLFPFLKSMLDVASEPTIRQQGFQRNRVARGDGDSGNPPQHVGQVEPHVHTVPPRTLGQRVRSEPVMPKLKAATETSLSSCTSRH